MTGKQLIDLIQKNGLEDFEMKLICSEFYETPNAGWSNFEREVFSIDASDNLNPTDIGYSDKIFILSLVTNND